MFGFSACELPDEGVERGEFPLDFEECLCVGDGGGDFGAVFDHAVGVHESFKIGLGVSCDFLGVESVEGLFEFFASFEDNPP